MHTMEHLTETHELILKENCLCSFSTDHLLSLLNDSSWFSKLPNGNLSSKIFSRKRNEFLMKINGSVLCSYVDISENHQLLSSSIMRHLAEAYVVQCLKTSFVCKRIFHIIHNYHSDDTWTNMITHCSTFDNKYVQYSFIKTLAAIIHTFPSLLLKTRLQMLLNYVIKGSEKAQCCILELIISLLSFNLNSFIKHEEIHSSCCNSVSWSGNFQDVLHYLCLELSENWNTLKSILLKESNPNVNTFLTLWNHLIEKHLVENYPFSSPSPNVAMEFLTLSAKLSPVSFQLYTNITCQIFCSSYNSISPKTVGNAVTEEAVLKAVQNGLLENIPIMNSSLTFCSTITSLPSCSSSETSILVKKSIFVVINLLADFKCVSSIYMVLETLQLCATALTVIKSCESDYSFIVDVFIGEDDLLFGAMLTLLRIYLIVKEGKSSDSCDLNRKLNPHRIFTKFLKQIGYNHTELLSFLISNETCCLLYLLTFVKYFLSDFDSFVRGDNPLHSKHFDIEYKVQCIQTKSNPNTLEKVIEPSSSMHSSLTSISQVSPQNSTASKLVLYSSSSSSNDEESDTECDTSCDFAANSNNSVQRVLSVFLHLKEAIQKLVDVNEFPYSVTPLILLLGKCEKYIDRADVIDI